MNHTTSHLGKSITWSFDYYDGHKWIPTQRDGKIYSVLISVTHGIYGYRVKFDNGRECNFIDYTLPETKNLIGMPINEITIKEH